MRASKNAMRKEINGEDKVNQQPKLLQNSRLFEQNHQQLDFDIQRCQMPTATFSGYAVYDAYLRAYAGTYLCGTLKHSTTMDVCVLEHSLAKLCNKK